MTMSTPPSGALPPAQPWSAPNAAQTDIAHDATRAADGSGPLLHVEATQASLQEPMLPVLVSMQHSASPNDAAARDAAAASADDDGARLQPPTAPQPLPPALQPWHAWLQWFPHDSALAIGGLLPRLHAAMGQYRGTLQRGAHTPNGIDELRRRGPYHRLLLSEWALADEMPDEFLRRATSGEHLFLSPRYETIKADAQLIAIFDAGPAQFGASRLAHIALWILLARRAELAGIGFRWGLLGAPGALDGGGDAQALKRLLSARTLTHADAAKIDAWREALATEPTQGGERWLIAGARAPIAGITHRVSIARDLHNNLSVRIASPAGQRDVDVPLPPAKASVRLLRGAFAFEVAATQTLADADAPDVAEKLSLRQPPLIGPEGRQIAVPVLGESAAMVFVVGLQKREANRQAWKKSARKMRWATGNDLLCAAMSRKSFGGIVGDAHHLHFWQIDGFRVLPRPPNDQLKAPPGQAHWLPCLWFNSGTRPHHLMMLDHDGRLLSFAGNKAGAQNVEMTTLDDRVIAIARADDDHIAYLHYRQHKVELKLRHRRDDMGKIRRLAYALQPEAPDKGFIHGRLQHGGGIGAWCVRTQRGKRDESPSEWTVYPISKRFEAVEGQPIQVQDGWQVVGLAAVPNSLTAEYGLVVIAANRKRLVLLRGVGSETLYASARSITAASVATDCDLIALITEDRQMVVLTPGGDSQRWNADDADDDA